ncbi:hypothetical protein [Corallococcus terminator]|uniref:Uncharacterized protein n=1 Tax=Corallococcus terminator TaxID=2316733 RepID=A0A3A8JR01_9BACT|nr:hypothetical protein [Corallococcus terminator]RKG92851.1 hypothetical protein D7V88_04610 [Corallococcus terminator]
MTRKFVQAFSLVAALVLTSTTAVAGERLAAYLPRLDAPKAPTLECTDPRAQLHEAAKKAGVDINPEETVTVSKDGLTFAGSSIAGFEQVPASALPEGVDFGFTFLDAPQAGIPAGYYKLRARAAAEDIQVGEYRGEVDVIDASGKAVARLPATMQTSSVEVPKPLPFARTTVDAQFRQTNFIGGRPDQLSRYHHTLIIIYHCPNGTTFIIFLDYWDWY